MTGEDSEKRFHSVMDKLFHSPKPKPSTSSSSGNQSSNGKGRGDSTKKAFESNTSSRSVVSVRRSSKRSGSSSLPSEAPMCRPWDRRDLLRRLATFKSMTWFGKPKTVSAVNCARRGWINVEMDIIACEACGARLLFSNPSSWTHHQIEKAAAVFSLKLDNGHRSLCPWINNACDEKLAQFPPTTAPALADGYKERSFALLQLSALPIVSSSAIDSVRNPQLEKFLERSSTLELGPGFKDSSTIEDIGNEHEAISAHLYYQAQKFVALCGWEPRSLPYVVDCEDWSAKSAEKAHPNDPTHFVSGRNPGIIMNSLSGSGEIREVDDGHQPLSGQQSGATSVVLDCKLCGSSVGLWAFSTVQRPLELYRITGSSEVTGISESANCDFINCPVTETPRTDESGKEIRADCNGGVLTPTSMKERSLSLNLSIAGGPSPAKQNYRATISLPIISRHLRAGLSSNSNARDRMNLSCMNQVTPNDVGSNNLIHQKNDQTNNTPCRQIVQPEDMGTLKRKRTEDGVCNSRDGDVSCRNSETNEEDPLRKENNDMSSKVAPPLHTLGTCPNTGLENPIENMQKEQRGSDEDDAHGGNSGKMVDSTSQSKECLVIGSDASKSVENGETSKNNPLMTTTGEVCSHQQDQDLSGTDVLHCIGTSDASHQESCILSSLEANATVDKVDSREGDQGNDFLRPLDVQVTNQKVNGVKNTVQSSVYNEVVSSGELGKDPKSDNSDEAMEFDPIRQHRHFCPWITSTGNAAPGWQQTLSALDRGKESSHPKESPSKSMSEADDPIISIRKLFMSPSAKKAKLLKDQANRY